MLGCAIGYWQGDVMKLVDDIAALKPAMFIGVPRVFDRIYSRINGQVRRGACARQMEGARGVVAWGARTAPWGVRAPSARSRGPCDAPVCLNNLPCCS